MQTTLIAFALIAGSGSLDSQSGFDSLPEAASALAPTLQTGSLIFSEGDCLAVRVFTASPYTHVATVVRCDGDECWVYDSTSGVGVRRLTLEQYLLTQAPAQIQIHHLQRPLTADEARSFEGYLQSQLGRPYAIRHHLTGERCEGVHCAEYVTDALMSIERVDAHRPPRVSPASLREGVTVHGVYDQGRSIQLQRPAPPADPASNGCEQLWIDTKSCCRNCCRKLQGWILCQ